MLAGQLTGSVDGRPISIDAEGPKLVIKLPGLTTAWRLRRTWPSVRKLIDHVAPFYGVEIACQVPLVGSFTLSPSRPWWVRLALR
ncbi:MAG: hypothetical protein AAF711_19830 [Planctomycetota bacterium]